MRLFTRKLDLVSVTRGSGWFAEENPLMVKMNADKSTRGGKAENGFPNPF